MSLSSFYFLNITPRGLTSCILIWVFPKIGVPQNGWFIRQGKTILELMIWGYPYFWKHPYRYVWWTSSLTRRINDSKDLLRWIVPMKRTSLSTYHHPVIQNTLDIQLNTSLTQTVWKVYDFLKDVKQRAQRYDWMSRPRHSITPPEKMSFGPLKPPIKHQTSGGVTGCLGQGSNPTYLGPASPVRTWRWNNDEPIIHWNHKHFKHFLGFHVHVEWSFGILNVS